MQTLQAAMKDADVTTEQLDWLVLHQANQRILDAAAQRIGISSDRVVSNLAEYGNTSAASIPLAFDEAVRGGKIKNGDTVSSSAPMPDLCIGIYESPLLFMGVSSMHARHAAFAGEEPFFIQQCTDSVASKQWKR